MGGGEILNQSTLVSIITVVFYRRSSRKKNPFCVTVFQICPKFDVER
jgi:hypothetical protein